MYKTYSVKITFINDCYYINNMKGIIFTFGDLSPSELVKKHNEVLGRVVKVKRGGTTHYYYYAGLLDNIPFLKISNGCYFLPNVDKNELSIPRKYIIEADLEINKKDLKTGAQYFLEKYKGVKVNNLG